MSNPEAEKECIICGVEGMQESRTHIPSYSFAVELAPDASWDAEEAKKKSESKWELKSLAVFIQSFMGTKFQVYTFLAHNAEVMIATSLLVNFWRKWVSSAIHPRWQIHAHKGTQPKHTFYWLFSFFTTTSTQPLSIETQSTVSRLQAFLQYC